MSAEPDVAVAGRPCDSDPSVRGSFLYVCCHGEDDPVWGVAEAVPGEEELAWHVAGLTFAGAEVRLEELRRAS